MLALCDEGGSGIVDEDVERRLAPDRIHHAVDRRTVADIAGDGDDRAAGLVAHLARRRLEPLELAAADHELGAEREEATPHRSAETRTTPGNEGALVLQQACFKHRLNPFSADFVIASHRVRAKRGPMTGFAKQFRLFRRTDSGLLRCARNDG